MSRKGLMEQDLSKLDVTKLHPLSPEVISRQATINIGNIFSPFFFFSHSSSRTSSLIKSWWSSLMESLMILTTHVVNFIGCVVLDHA